MEVHLTQIKDQAMLCILAVSLNRQLPVSQLTCWHLLLLFVQTAYLLSHMLSHPSRCMSKQFVVWPTMSCFADWSKRRHVTLSVIICSPLHSHPGWHYSYVHLFTVTQGDIIMSPGWHLHLGMLIPGKSHSRVESRNSRVSIQTLDFTWVPFTGVIGAGSPAEVWRGRSPTGPRRCSQPMRGPNRST